jgi:hypothetical protein
LGYGVQTKKVEKASKGKTGIVSSAIRNYEKHLFFLKKKEQAKAFLKKAGLPPLPAKHPE